MVLWFGGRYKPHPTPGFACVGCKEMWTQDTQHLPSLLFLVPKHLSDVDQWWHLLRAQGNHSPGACPLLSVFHGYFAGRQQGGTSSLEPS